jgi:hypothetical protein
MPPDLQHPGPKEDAYICVFDWKQVGVLGYGCFLHVIWTLRDFVRDIVCATTFVACLLSGGVHDHLVCLPAYWCRSWAIVLAHLWKMRRGGSKWTGSWIR